MTVDALVVTPNPNRFDTLVSVLNNKGCSTAVGNLSSAMDELRKDKINVALVDIGYGAPAIHHIGDAILEESPHTKRIAIGMNSASPDKEEIVKHYDLYLDGDGEYVAAFVDCWSQHLRE